MFHELCAHIYKAVCVRSLFKAGVLMLWSLDKRFGPRHDLLPLEHLCFFGMCVYGDLADDSHDPPQVHLTRGGFPLGDRH